MDSGPTRGGDGVLTRFVLEHLPDPVLVLDTQGQVLQRNRAARDRAHLAAFFERPDDDLATFLAKVRADGAAEADLTRATTGEPPSYLALAGTRMGDVSVVVARDVSADRARDEELRHLRRVEAVGMLAASVVHDFNNLLTPVLLLSGILRRTLESTDSEPFAEQIHAAAERCAVLVRDVLAFARPGVTRTASVDLARTLTDLRPLIERVAGDRVKTDLVLDPTLGRVELDRAGLEHALLNLVTNAREAMPHGGRLTITASSSVASDDPVAGPRGAVTLTVRDTGVGMSDDARQRAFERFFTTKPLGNGIGLASVRGFVDEAGGAVSVESAPGRGTTVTLRLPSVETDDADVAARPAPPPRGGDETILVVDRATEVRSAVRVALEANGYNVVEAESTERALEAARASTIDLVLVDADLSREVEAHITARRGAAPVVMFADRSAAEIASQEAVLHKAFSELELLTAVRGALDARSRDA